MYTLASVPDGSVIQFSHSARYYLKVCGEDGIGGVVALDNGLYVKTSDLSSCLGLSPDEVEIVTERGDWDVWIKRYRVRVQLP
jgi:hypothetical protein